MKITRKQNELLFCLSITTLILYGIYALLSLVTTSSIPLFVSFILLGSLLITIFLFINYELEFDEIEVVKEEAVETLEIDDNLVSLG